MDLMMNVNDLSIEISNGVYYPGPGNYGANLNSNNDITILHSAFDTNLQNSAITTHDGVEVSIYAPKHTPFIFRSGTSAADIYMLPGGVDCPNKITLYTKATINARFFGSGMFTSVDKIETMFTQYRSVVSDNIEKIVYGNSTVFPNTGDFNINAKSVTEIKLDIPNMGGKLIIDSNCQSLMKLNIANSNFYGQFNGFANLQEVNISGVSSNASDGIVVSGSNYLTGEKFHISGSDENHKTTLTVLELSGVTGNFVCEYTEIDKIRISNNTDRKSSDFDTSMLSEFYISGDKRLTELQLEGFRKVHIDKCINLKTLTFVDDALEELYINLEKGKNEESSQLNTIFLNKNEDVNSGVITHDNDENIIYVYDKDGNKIKLYDPSDGTGVFDFTNFKNLKRVTLINCDKLVHVKLPDQDIETDGMSSNDNLRWIDTGILPSFKDDENKKPYDGYTEGTGDYIGYKFPIYSKGHKLILCSDSAFYNCPNYAMLRSDWDKGSDMIGNENYIAYTNIIVSDKCTSLSNTFCISSSNSTDDKFNMNTAIRFIEICVPDNVKEKITSLAGCFKGRKGVKYTEFEAQNEKGYNSSTYKTNHHHPMLEKYASLTNISELYANTGVNFVSKFLLDLPSDKNTSEDKNVLNWDSFVRPMTTLRIADDALYNISYRIRSYSYITFHIYEYINGSYNIIGEDTENPFRICDFFYPYDKGKIYTDDGCKFDASVEVYDNITSFDSLNFCEKCIDFRGMFNLFPNVSSISSSFNGNLGLYNIQGLLYPCKNIISIVQSFCDKNINDVGNTQEIDLFNFFDWENNTTDVERLFEGSQPSANGFAVRKTITYDNLTTVLGKISEYTKLTRLTNLFSFCTITGCNDGDNINPEIKFNDGVVLSNIVNISNLFDRCTSDYRPFSVNDAQDSKGIYTGGVLNIGRSFFKSFPNFTTARRTLADTYLSSPLTYDYFCRRSEDFVESTVYLSEDINTAATLRQYVYNSNIIDLTEFFCGTKFVYCNNWFDQNDEVNVGIINKDVDRNHIRTADGHEIYDIGTVYYTYSLNKFKEHILDNDIIDDCFDNYTDFIPENAISPKMGDSCIWKNHDLKQDLLYYGNIIGEKLPYDYENEFGVDTIQETYCCLPPDILYGCASSAVINDIFANTNITGVIPRNLTKNVKDRSISNIFRNVNIMPNLEYYYDANDVKDGIASNGLGAILDKITETVEVENAIGEFYTVVFRDEYGKLKKRKPVDSDRSLGQFVYVPANFTTCGTIMNAFNFRYNLPKHWLMSGKSDYESTKDFNDAISEGSLNLYYRSQYYFTTDKSVRWDILYDAKSVFIHNDQDVDFSNNNIIGNSRQYYDDRVEMLVEKKNVWTNDKRVYTPIGWATNIMDYFYIDLNLCGRKNKYNMIEDYGCPIVIGNNKIVQLDNFVSGILTIFLNGRVFREDFLVDKLTTTHNKSSSSSSIIDYYGFGKNIILPYFRATLSDEDLSFIPIDNDYLYFDFMVESEKTSMDNYYEQLAKDNLNDGKNLFETKYSKYKCN
jgi:hypothetical protein